MKIRGESGGLPARMGGGAGAYSTRSSQLDKGTKRVVKKQNKAADSYKIKDMDQLEKGRAYRAEKKLIDAAKKAKDLKEAQKKGKIKGAAATVAVGVGALAVANNEKKKAKPTPSPKPSSKKLTPDQAKLAKVVQRISAIDKKKK